MAQNDDNRLWFEIAQHMGITIAQAQQRVTPAEFEEWRNVRPPNAGRAPNSPITCPNCDEETLLKGNGGVWRCPSCGYEELR